MVEFFSGILRAQLPTFHVRAQPSRSPSPQPTTPRRRAKPAWRGERRAADSEASRGGRAKGHPRPCPCALDRQAPAALALSLNRARLAMPAFSAQHAQLPAWGVGRDRTPGRPGRAPEKDLNLFFTVADRGTIQWLRCQVRPSRSSMSILPREDRRRRGKHPITA